MREPALAKNKSASVSLSFATSFAPSVGFLSSPYVSLAVEKNLPEVTLSRTLYARTHRQDTSSVRLREIESRARRSTIAFTTCHRYLSTDQDGVRGKLLPEQTPSFSLRHSGCFYRLSSCLHGMLLSRLRFLLTSQSKLLDNFFGSCLTKVHCSRVFVHYEASEGYNLLSTILSLTRIVLSMID